MPDHRSDIDDTPLTGLHHAAHNRLGKTENSFQVGVENSIPLIVFQPHRDIVTGNAGIVDENSNSAIGFVDPADQGVDLFGITHLKHGTLTFDAGVSQICSDFSGAFITCCCTDHGGTKPAKLASDGLANPARGAGNESNLSVQHNFLLQSRNRSINRRQISQRKSGHTIGAALAQTRQDFTGTALGNRCSAE